jgi:hypothetical protein
MSVSGAMLLNVSSVLLKAFNKRNKKREQEKSREENNKTQEGKERTNNVIDRSKVNYSDWIRTALLQAVCFCSSVDDFNQKHIYTEWLLVKETPSAVY